MPQVVTPQLTLIVYLSAALDHLATCLEGLLEQDDQQCLEILWIDDQGQGDRQSVLEAIYHQYDAYLAQHQYRFRYIQLTDHLGQYASINHGLTLATGQWFYCCNSDQRLLPSVLNQWQRVIQTQPDLELISCQFYRLNHQDEILEKSLPLATVGWVDDGFRRQILQADILPLNAQLIHRDLFSKVGYFDPVFSSLAAWEWLRRVSTYPAIHWYYLPEYLVCDRQLENPTVSSHTSLWQVLKRGEKYCSPTEQRLTKKHQYLTLFTLADQFLAHQALDQVCAMMVDIVQYSDLGDRLWLEVLNQGTFKHKQELYNFIVQFSQKPYLQ